MHKVFSTNSLTEGLEKNDKQLEWYKKKKDQFYSKQKIPNDEEIQQYFLVYLDETKSEKFIDQLCFTSLEETTSVITIVLKKMHEKLNEMYSEQIAEYLIHNDELEKNFKKKKSNTQNSGNSNATKKKKKNIKKPKTIQNGNGNNTNIIAPIKEPTFAEEVRLLHQQQLLQEQQENQKQQQKQLQVQSHEKSCYIKPEDEENNENCEETSTSLENSKKSEQNKNNVINNKKKINGNMPLVLKMQQQQKKNEFLEECCQQNKCEMLDLTKGIAQKLINSCILGVDQYQQNDTYNEEKTINQKCYETDQSFTSNTKISNSGISQSISQITQSTQQSVLTKKKKKGKNGNNQISNILPINNTAQANSKSKQKKQKDQFENTQDKTEDILNDDEDKEDQQNQNNVDYKCINSPLEQNIDEDDTEELPLLNYTDSDRDGAKKGSEIHSDYTTIEYTGDQYGMRSVITISSSSKCKQSDSHNNSNSSSRHTTKNINEFSDEENYKQFKDEIRASNGVQNTSTKKNLQQQANNKQANKFMNIQQKSEMNQKNIQQNGTKTTDKVKKNIQEIKVENLKSRDYEEKETFYQETSNCTENICNNSVEKASIISSRSDSQLIIESVYPHSNQNRQDSLIDDSDFIQVGCRKKNSKTAQTKNSSGIKNNNRRNNNKNNHAGNGQNDRKNKNSNNEQNNNIQGNRRGNRGQNDSQLVQSDGRQNNHQNSNRNNRNTNQNEIQNTLTKTKSTIQQQNQTDKQNIGQEQQSQSTSTQSRYTQKSQASNQKDDNKQDQILISSSGQKKPQTQQATINIQSTQPKKTNNKISSKQIVAINTIDILTTKEDQIVETNPQVQDSQNIEPTLPSSKPQQIQNKQTLENNSKVQNDQIDNNINEGQTINKDSKQLQQLNNTNSIQTQQINQNQGDYHNQNQENNIQIQQAQQQNPKQCKMTPVKKQKLQQNIQKSPLNLNSEKFAIREEYVQKNSITQLSSQISNATEINASVSLSKENSNQQIISSSTSSQTTQAGQNMTSKKNQQQVNNRKKSNNQNVNSLNITTENQTANNTQRKCGNNNFQNQWKDPSDTSYPATNSFNQVHTSKNKAKITKRLFRKKITNDILSFTDMINNESLRHQPSRFLIFYRIQHLLKKQFEKIESQVDLRIFGSCATGLSLPTSDIDLGITGFECHPRSDLICVLSTLANILEQFKWVKSVERIFTASIPIIKMEVDPFIDFKESINSEELSIFFDPNEITQLNIPVTAENRNLQGMKLKVDITVECQMQSPNTEILNHMGFLSTDFVVRWMSYYFCLQPMTIVMKCFLHARNLNTNFKGGISSYCLLIMIIAFFRDNQNITQNDDYCNILQSFLKYYGTSFNPETTGISLVNTNPFYPCLRSISQSKLQVVDPLTSKIMTQNTYLIDEILKEIQGFYNKLNDFSKKIERTLEKMTYEQIEKIDHMDYEEQKEEFKILFEKNKIECIINDVDNTKTEFYEKVFKQEQLEHNKNVSVFRIQDQKQTIAESTTQNTTITQTTTSKRSKNYQSKQYNAQQNQSKQNSNRNSQKEQVQ